MPNPNIIPEGTANEAIFNALVRHQVYLLQFSGSVRNKINKLLGDAQEELEATIKRRLRNSTGLTSAADVGRLQTLMKIIANARTGMWTRIDEVWLENLAEVALQEPVTLARTLEAHSPTVLDLTLPGAAALKAIATTDPFEGRTLKQWAQAQKANDLARTRAIIQTGMVNNDTTDTIARSVRQNLEIAKRDAESITRTAINHVANRARTLTLLGNSDLIEEELFVATLDSRTTPVCRATDGKTFPVGKGRIPPLHFNCRSLRVPLLGEAVGNRPMKAVTEKQLLREWAQKNKLGKVPGSRGDLAYGTKTKFDRFATARTRQLTGTVPAATTYQDWLTKQTTDFQNDVLGITRGALFRKGGLKLDRFINRNGDEISLHELAQKEAAAFRKAGLDPGAY